MLAPPLVTLMVRTFAPVCQVADPPFVTGVAPFLISTSALLSVAVAVTVLVALVVVAVYSVTEPSKAGVSVSDPIVSPERVALKGLP